MKQIHNQFIQKYGPNQIVIPKFRWPFGLELMAERQKSFHDHVIRNENDFQNHYNYTAYNFLKHNLSEDWQYTSLNYPEMIDAI